MDDSPAVAQHYEIQEIPILILFQDGVEKERILGVASQEKISRAIDRYIRATPITPPIWNGSCPPPWPQGGARDAHPPVEEDRL